MARKNQHQVLISGAGPTGLAAALFLTQRGVAVDIIDERGEAKDDDVTVVLHADTVERLEDAGAHLDLAHHASPIDTVVVHDRSRRHASLALPESSVHPGPVVALPLRVVRDQLEAALRARGVKVQWHRRLARIDATADDAAVDIEVLDRDSAGYAVSHMEGIVVRVLREKPAHVIAADGPESTVRTQLRVTRRPVGPAKLVAAFEFDTRWNPGAELQIYVGLDSATLWPAPGGRVRLTFELSEATPLLDAWLAARHVPDRADLRVLMEAHLPWLDLPVERLRWSHVERYQAEVVDRAELGPTWLLGEAAHRFSPLASQSLNHAIHQAHDVAATIDDVARHQAGPDLFERLGTRLRTQSMQLAHLGDLYQPTDATDPFVAGNYRKILTALPASGRDLDDLAARLGLMTRAL